MGVIVVYSMTLDLAAVAAIVWGAAEPKPLPHKLAANACWFPSIGPGANTNANAPTVKAINVMVVFSKESDANEVCMCPCDECNDNKLFDAAASIMKVVTKKIFNGVEVNAVWMRLLRNYYY